MPNQSFKNLLICIHLISFGAVGVVFADTAAEIKERNRTIAEYYKLAMDSYYEGEYTVAISRWREILKIDPQQAQAQKLIQMANQQMKESIEPVSKSVYSLIEKGEYKQAYEKNKELLAFDSANKEWLSCDTKLELLIKIKHKIIAKDKVSRLIRKSMKAHLCPKVDSRLAVNAIRYAWQINRKYPGITSLKEMIENEYNSFAESERLIEGMNIIQQKLQASLSNIYDGKYDRAILECRDIIQLDPRNILALKRAGSAYYASGNKKRAKQVWTRASKIDPKDKELKKFLKLK